MSQNTPPEPENNPSQPAANPNEAAAQAEAMMQDALPEDPLNVALAEIAVLKAKSADLADQYLRTQADMQNVRRRADEDVAKARKYSIEGFAESLLPVLDSLEAGLAVLDASAQQLREGSEATLRQLKNALERNKVVEINPAAGSKLDPNLHQTISAVPSEHEANSVVGVLQKGYQIAERVLRPALITVAAAKN